MKQWIKSLLLMLTVVLVLGLLTTAVLAAGESGGTVIDRGTCGTNVSWTLTSDGVLTISGSGNMKNYTAYWGSSYTTTPVPWAKYYQSGSTGYYYDCYKIRKIVINEGVTSVGNYAFYRMRNLESVTLPQSLTKIGDHGIYWADSLKSITLPDNLSSLDMYCLAYSGLTEVKIPSSVEAIGTGAFHYCKALADVTLQPGLKTIGSSAFGYCTELTEIQFPDSVTEIGSTAFQATGLQTVTIPENVTSIRNYAFNGCTKLEQVQLPSTLQTLEAGVFAGCTALKSIEIPSTVTEIKKQAFYYTGLEQVTVPESVTAIGDYAFAKCTSLNRITLPTGLKSLARCVLWRCEALKEIEIPQQVTVIGQSALAGCISLEKVVIPTSVTEIRKAAFCNDAALQTLDYQGTPELWKQITVSTDRNNYLLRLLAGKLVYCTASTTYSSYIYTGEPVTPTVRVYTLKGTLLKKDTNYTVTYENNVESGTATAIVTGIGKYSGTIRVNFEITRYAELSECRVSSQYTVYGCTGQPIEPNLKVRTRNGARLTKDVHYTVTYENNVDCGTATATITGINGCTGSIRYTFRILPARVKDLTVIGRTKRTLELKWTPAPVATQYNVYLNGVLTGVTTENTILLTQLNPRCTYRIKVRAVIKTTNAAGSQVQHLGNTAQIQASTL